jgi:hypothetical protein
MIAGATATLTWAAWARAGALAATALLCTAFQGQGGPARVDIPLSCTRGSGGQSHGVTVTVPARITRGSRYRVHVDGVDSGKISYVGLNYIFDVGSRWLVPPGTRYVEGSARVLPGTGSENVRAGARVGYAAGVVELVLPARIENGSRFTPPSFEFELEATAPEGASITQSFGAYRLSANAFLLGDVTMSCEPTPKPFPVASTRVEAADGD